jgi:hypothetical protein
VITQKRVDKHLRHLHARRHRLLSKRRGGVNVQRALDRVCAEIDLWEMWEYRPIRERQMQELRDFCKRYAIPAPNVAP